METGIDPKVDIAFKRVFAGKECLEITPDLLNAILKLTGKQRIVSVEILNPFSLKEFVEDRQIILDVKARDETGREFLIEMQMVVHPYFPERLLYYLAKNYSQQLDEGEKWRTLKPVIVICFINDVLYPKTTDYHSCYEMRELNTGAQFSEHWTIHIFELPKFHKSLSELSSDLDRWTYFLQHGNELDPDALPPSLETPAVHLAAKVLQTMSHDTLERHQYEARLRFLRDQATSLAFAEEKGREEGREEGREDEARRMVIRIGTTRLGPPPGEIIARLNLIKSLERIESLGDRILDCPNWNSLLEGVSE